MGLSSMSLPDAGSQNPAYLVTAEDLRPNPGQWQVYESKGHCVALAGPGSGKTKTLTIKLARVLAEDVRPPRGIACITYSNECVRELRRRLDKLGVSQSTNLFIGTIHSFCLVNVLKPYGKMAGLILPEPLAVASPGDQRRFFENAREAVFGYSGGASRTDMDWYRRSVPDRDSPEWRLINEPISHLVEAYEQELRSSGFIDFDDMVLLGLKLIERHEWVRKLLKARFPILVVDEYQDLGLPLHRIVLELCFKAGIRLLAVGDPDQSIYGFTGAKPELLRKLAERADVEDISLRLNYRCGTTIVRASEMVLGLELGQFDTPKDALEGTIDFHLFPNGIGEQAEKICKEIIPEVLSRRDGRALGDITVLYLDKNDGDVIADAAKGAGFDIIRIDANAPYLKTPLTRWLEDCAAWCAGGWQRGEPRLSSLIQTWMGFNGRVESSDSQAIELKRRLVRYLWAHHDAKSSLETWLYALDSDCLRHTFHKGCELQDEFEALDQLLCACAPGGQIENWTVATFAGQGGSPSHLNLITLHSAKGREFEVVIMMGMDQGRIPWTNDGASKKAEKRRLFYVGVTRAKYEVHMTYSGWYRDTYDNIREYGPSEFLQELVSRLREQPESVDGIFDFL
jgi:DNA helicase-2/ATP-dependent DNA helicase PcrA